MAEIPQIVGRRLRAVAQPAAHLDPNLFSAFVEKSLGRREQVQVLQHLCVCAHCRELASLATAQPETANAVSAALGGSSWLSWPVLRWGAVAAVVVVAAVVTFHHPRREVLPSARSAVVTPQSAQIAWPSAPSVATAMVAAQSEAKAGHPVEISKPSAPAPVEMADARAGSPVPGIVPGRAKDAPAELQNSAAAKAMSMAPASRERRMAAAAGVTNFAGQTSIPECLTPRWTLSSDGTLQRSLDSGRSWQAIPVATQTIFRALAANGLDIWVGGSAGALYHSSDAGQHWSQVQPSVNGEVLADDIIGVEFVDTLHGKLTTSNDETWSTADAGQTWQKQ